MDSDLFQNSQIATEEKSILEINSNNFDKNVFCTFNVEKNFNANLYKSANQHAKRQQISQKIENPDLQGLIRLRNNYKNNPFIVYLDINNLGNKIDDLNGECNKASIYVLCIDETRLNTSCPDPLFKIPGYQYPPYRKDRNSGCPKKALRKF